MFGGGLFNVTSNLMQSLSFSLSRHAPRKCSATNRLIIAKDHASVQITVGDVDEEGKLMSTGTSFALCGQVRADGEGDDSLNRLATKAGLLRNVWSYQK